MGKSVTRVSIGFIATLLFVMLAMVPVSAFADDAGEHSAQEAGKSLNELEEGGVDSKLVASGQSAASDIVSNEPSDVSEKIEAEEASSVEESAEQDETKPANSVNEYSIVAGGTNSKSASDAVLATRKAAGTQSKYETPLEEGTYMIATAKSSTKVLDVAGGSKDNGANVLLWTWHDAAWQKWQVTCDSEGLYTIKNVHTGKVLDVAGALASKGANVLSWQEKSSDAANQQWILEKLDTGYILKSALNQSLVLDCAGNSAADGTNIEIWSANGQLNQCFYFVSLNPDVTYGETLEEGIYTMGVSSKPTQLVEVEGQSIKNDANVDLYASNEGMNQQWSFQYNGAGLYRVVNVGSGLSLDVANAAMTAGANVLQYSANTGMNQLWGVARNADDTYTLYSALNGLVLDVTACSTANLANLETYYSNGGENQKFVLEKVPEDYSGTFQLASHLSQTKKLIDVPGDSVADNTQMALWDPNEQLNQRFVFEKTGSAYTIRPVSSGKYLTETDGKIVQASAQGEGETVSDSQLWTVVFAENGFQIKNVGTGNVMSVDGSNAVNSAKIQGTLWNGSASQKFLLAKCEMLPRALYVVTSAANESVVLDAEGASFADGANTIVYKASGMNNQKFAFALVSNGYYRVTLALGGTVLGVGDDEESSVKLYDWTGADSQLWKPILTNGGFFLQNKESGLNLAAAGKSSGSDAVQKNPSDDVLQKWRFAKSTVNLKDMASFVKCVDWDSGLASLTVTRAAIDFSTSSSEWKALQNALAQCWNAGFNVGFIAVDCETGMTVSVNSSKTFYGASTIKALYVTYLIEELVEKGSISLGSVQGLMYDAIVYSSNDAYATLRYNYGSQSGFNAWLAKVSVGSLSTYDYYTPKTLAKAWVHILEYESSNGKYVGFWRSIFDHGTMSSINDALGCTVYSKPGWYYGGTPGDVLDDAGIVKNGSGTYVLAIMSTAEPSSQKWRIENLVYAINNVMATIPSTR